VKKSSRIVPAKPFLNAPSDSHTIETHILGNLTAPFRDKDVANVVLKDGLGVLRLWTGCDLGIKIDLEVVLGKLIELDPTSARIGAVDPDAKPEAIHLQLRFVHRWEVGDETNYEGCLLLSSDTVTGLLCWGCRQPFYD
jgi:hypothetical protein